MSFSPSRRAKKKQINVFFLLRFFFFFFLIPESTEEHPWLKVSGRVSRSIDVLDLTSNCQAHALTTAPWKGKKKCVGLHPNAGLTLCDVSAHQSVQISHVRLPRYGLMSLDPQCGKPRVLTGVDTICVDVLKGKNTKINIVKKD